MLNLKSQTAERKFTISAADVDKFVKAEVCKQLNLPGDTKAVSISWTIDSGVDYYDESGNSNKPPHIIGLVVQVNDIMAKQE